MGDPAVPDLHGRRGHDGLRSPDRQSHELPARRSSSVRYFRRLFRRHRPGLQRQGRCRHLHHRRRGRPDLHLPVLQAGPDGAFGTDRRGCLLLHVPGPHYPAAHHARADHGQGEKDQDGAAPPRLQTREDPVPDRRHGRRLHDPAHHSAPGRYADAGQPLPRERRRPPADRDCLQCPDVHCRHPAGHLRRRNDQRRGLPQRDDPQDRRPGPDRFLLRYRCGLPLRQDHVRRDRRQGQSADRLRRRLRRAHGRACLPEGRCGI